MNNDLDQVREEKESKLCEIILANGPFANKQLEPMNVGNTLGGSSLVVLAVASSI